METRQTTNENNHGGGGGTNCMTQTAEQHWMSEQLYNRGNTDRQKTTFKIQHLRLFLAVLIWFWWFGSKACADTHSDPDESPSTVPALMRRATPFSWSGRLGLAGPARLSLEEDPCGDADPGALSHSSLWIRCRPFLSTIGESCFFFRIPEQD